MSRSSVEKSRWAPRLGAIFGTSSSPFDLARPDLVGPDAGRVDHVVGLDRDRLAGFGVGELDPVALPRFSVTRVTWAPFRQTAPNRWASPRMVRTRRTSSVWQS